MHGLSIARESLRHKTRPLGSDASLASPSDFATRERGVELEQAYVALSEAERTIRNQEERIRQLENMALTDELTGLLNRRGFALALHRELSIARRDSHATGILVMVDLDGFKSINDLWGHSVGDDYLKSVAHALLTEVRSTDVVARIGGDEFAVMLTRMDTEIGMDRMRHLEQSFNSRAMQWQDKVLPLRASFGLSVYSGAQTADELLRDADMKLYAHKARRRMIKN